MAKIVVDHWSKQKRNVVTLAALRELYKARDLNDRNLCIEIMTREGMWCLPMPDGNTIHLPEVRAKFDK